MTWAGGLVNDTDGFVGIAYVAGPPHIARRTCLVNDWVRCGGVISLGFLTGCAGARARNLTIDCSTYS